MNDQTATTLPIDPGVEPMRRLCFIISSAARDVGVTLWPGRPLRDQLEEILLAAMEKPLAIGPERFEIIYRLRATAA